MQESVRQKDRAVQLLKKEGMLRLREFREAGITAAAVCRLVEGGHVVRLDRGLYQLASAQRDAAHELAMAAKLVPTGVVCLASALSYHNILDSQPNRLWLAIRRNDWAPKSASLPIRYIRFADPYMDDSVITTVIEGVSVQIFDVAKTIADCFAHRRVVGRRVAMEGLILAFKRRRIAPAKIAELARRRGMSKIMRPYVDALVANENW